MAPGFVVDDPATWTYKSIPALSIKASHDEHIRPGIPPEDAYGSILAYRVRFQNGLITGTETFFGLTWTQFYFSDPSGIMELYVTTDFAENNLDDLILYASVRNTPLGTDVEVDAGNGVTVTFDEVTGTGNTTATEITCSAAAPSGFRILPLDDDPHLLRRGDHSYLFRHYRGLIISHLCHFTDESESIKLNLLRIDDGRVLVTLSKL